MKKILALILLIILVVVGIFAINYKNLQKKKEEIKDMEILSLTENNRIKEIKVGEEIIDGVTFKKLLNLPSDDITIIINEKNVRFITRGYGISLGLSQFGANEMAKNNCSYTDIIRYYYPSVVIKRFV